MNELTNPKPSVETSESFLNKTELGQRLGVRPRTIAEWMTRGMLPYYKVGRVVRFKWSDVEEHLGRTCRIIRRNRRAV